MDYLESEKRKWKRQSVDFCVRLIFPKRGIKEVHETKLRLHDLSEGGAAIVTEGLTQVPDFFYMEFGQDAADMIGCYVVGRTPRMVHCQFWRELSTKHLERIIARRQLESAFDSLYVGEAQSAANQLCSLLRIDTA